MSNIQERHLLIVAVLKMTKSCKCIKLYYIIGNIDVAFANWATMALFKITPAVELRKFVPCD